MVLYDPMSPEMLQLVTSHPATDKKLFPRRAPPWAGDISKLSPAQLRSCIAFAEFGINNLRGMSGTTSYQGNTVSNTAVEVATSYPNQGQGAFGGQSGESRRQEQRQRAENNLQSLRDELQRKESAQAAGQVQTSGQ